MTDNRRDFFISFNSADLAYAEAIDAALRQAGFTTYYHPRDVLPGSNVPAWMEEALLTSSQTLALFSPDYVSDRAVYSFAELYASWWQDAGGDNRKLIPILLRKTAMPPLTAMLSRIETIGLAPKEAAKLIVDRLLLTKSDPHVDHVSRSPPPEPLAPSFQEGPAFYVERGSKLDELHRSLRDDGSKTVAIVGMGGIGKTTLAREYFARFGRNYDGRWWIDASSEHSIIAALCDLGEKIGAGKGNASEVLAQKTIQRLAGLSAPWLLIFDDATDPRSIKKWIPGGAVKCIIISRSAEFQGAMTTILLDRWSDNSTTEYLLARTSRDDTAGARRLAKTLGGLPLAADLAAAYLRNHRETSFDHYNTSLTSSMHSAADANFPETETINSAFRSYFELLRSMNGGPVALEVLSLCSYLSADGIDLALFAGQSVRHLLPKSLVDGMSNGRFRADIIAALSSLSLTRLEEGPTGLTLVFHRLLLDFTRALMTKSDRIFWGNVAVKLVEAAFPKDQDDPLSWPICARLMPHVSSLTLHLEKSESMQLPFRQLSTRAQLFEIARDKQINSSDQIWTGGLDHHSPIPQRKPRVFLVHGRNHGALYEVAFYLTRLGLEPIILHEQPSRGRTLINKFQDESAGVDFAIVLMTPDDLGRLSGEEDLSARARQNVIFELGFFLGRFGSDRVCALVTEPLEKPSDYDGVVYINFNSHSAWKSELARELRAAGMPIDPAGLI